MTIASITNQVGAGAPAARAAAATGAALGKDDFLRLLVTQLRYQDPLNPLDQNQFLSQTAQFTSLEQLQNISKALENLNDAAGATSLGQAAGLVGRTARAAARDFAYDGGAIALPFRVDEAVSRVSVDVVDRDGYVLRRLETGSQEAGAGLVTWDGLDTEGRAVGAGTYAYRVSAGSVPAVAVEGTVRSVALRDGGVVYRVGDATTTQGDIIEVL